VTWQAGSLPDPNSTYYLVCRRGDAKCWESPLARERVLGQDAPDQGELRLQTSWGPGDYFVFFVQVVYDAGFEHDEPISNYVFFHIP
jgi:hypothetical protein